MTKGSSSFPRPSALPRRCPSMATSAPSASTRFATSTRRETAASTRAPRSTRVTRWDGESVWEQAVRISSLRWTETPHRNEELHPVALFDAILIVVDDGGALLVGLVGRRPDGRHALVLVEDRCERD